MKYSLSEAAKATGKNKSTIQRAIKSGKISALKGETGAYQIDPSELHRIFPVATSSSGAQQGQCNNTQRNATANIYKKLPPLAHVEKELAVALAKNAGLEEQKMQMQETIDDLRKRLDASETRVTAILTDQRPQGFWGKLFR